MPSTTLSRRRVLAAVGTTGLAALSGCADRLAGATGDDSPATASIDFTLSEPIRNLRDRYVLDLAETAPPWDEEALAAAVAGAESGTVTNYTTRYRRPFPRDGPVWASYEGTYYRLGQVVVGEEEVTHPVLRLYEVKGGDGGGGSGGSGGDDESGSDGAAAVDSDDLPEIDRVAVRVAYMAARARGNVGGVPWGLVQRGGYVYRGEEAVEASELLADGGPERVAYRDRVWRVEVSTETFHEAVYRPVAEPVAETDAAMEAALRGRLVGPRLDPDALSAAEREVFRTAQAGEYTAEHPFPDAFVSVLKRLDERAYIDGNVTKDAGANDYPPRDLLRYGDAYHEYSLVLDEAETRA